LTKRTWALPIQFGYEQTSIWWITVSRSGSTSKGLRTRYMC
jgi:hypothetical protein